MDSRGFEVIRGALPDKFDVSPMPNEGEDLRFVTVDTNGEPHAKILNLLHKSDLLALGPHPEHSDLPQLEPYTVSNETITFIDRDADVADYDFGHLDEDELQKIRRVEETPEDTFEIFLALHDAGIRQQDICVYTNLSRPAVHNYISESRKGSGTKNPHKNAYVAVSGLKNTLLDLVGKERLDMDTAVDIIGCFYEEVALDSWQHPFSLTSGMRSKIRLAEKMRDSLGSASSSSRIKPFIEFIVSNDLIAGKE